MGLRISLDLGGCPGPFSCGRCLDACDQGVLMARPFAAPAGGREYRVVIVLRHRCTACRRCVDACPTACIAVRA
jgi:NAD-dependent dihydropyrimidine dehydrogenase PreA subunit